MAGETTMSHFEKCDASTDPNFSAIKGCCRTSAHCMYSFE